MNEYEKQAQDFLEETGATIETRFLRYDKYFANDTKKRLVYGFTITRNGHEYNGEFGTSLINLQKVIDDIQYNGRTIATDEPIIKFADCKKYHPTAYDILTHMEKYGGYEDLWDFAMECGLKIKDKKSYQNAEDAYNAMMKEYIGMLELFGDVMEELRGI